MPEESNARYLSLALDARRVIDVLVAYVKETDTARMEEVVRSVMDSLESAQDRESLFSSAQRRSLFGDHERMQTLEEVQTSFPSQDLTTELEALLRPDVAVETRKRNAEMAIQFFCALEGRALQRYTQAMDM
ncbi:MAG: hypothetical protein ACLPN2_19830 [Terriglobales bacterium]